MIRVRSCLLHFLFSNKETIFLYIHLRPLTVLFIFTASLYLETVWRGVVSTTLEHQCCSRTDCAESLCALMTAVYVGVAFARINPNDTDIPFISISWKLDDNKVMLLCQHLPVKATV